MSKQTDTGGPAYPEPSYVDLDQTDPCLPSSMGEITCTDGMTLLDYFAGQALKGFLSSLVTEEERAAIGKKATEAGLAGNVYLSELAYEHAEAMIAEKRKREAGE